MAALEPVLVGPVVTAAILPGVVALLRRIGAEDAPNARSSHRAPAVRGLGAACLVGWLVAWLFLTDVHSTAALALAGPVVIGAVGLADDLRGGISPTTRLAATALVAAATSFLLNHATGSISPLWVPLGLLWITYFTNAFNFMDGIDGISATTVAVAGVAYGWMNIEVGNGTLAEAAVVLACLAVVFGAANILGHGLFLGDSGSYFFGAALATIALASFLSGLGAVATSGPLMLYASDTLLVIGRRIRNGESLTVAHRRHVYQRLVDHGLSHAYVASIVGAITSATSLVASLTVHQALGRQILGGIVMLSLTCAYLALPSGMTHGQPARRPLRRAFEAR